MRRNADIDVEIKEAFSSAGNGSFFRAEYPSLKFGVRERYFGPSGQNTEPETI